jgi:hypothetical protein
LDDISTAGQTRHEIISYRFIKGCLLKDNRSYLEKRTNARITVHLPIQYRSVENPPGMEKRRGHVGLAKDLSLDGLYLKIPKDMKVATGDILRLDITLPEVSKHLFAFAEVAWRNPKGAGIRLLQMPVEDRDSLKDYLTAKVLT